jgi:hypothetical protein
VSDYLEQFERYIFSKNRHLNSFILSQFDISIAYFDFLSSLIGNIIVSFCCKCDKLRIAVSNPLNKSPNGFEIYHDATLIYDDMHLIDTKIAQSHRLQLKSEPRECECRLYYQSLTKIIHEGKYLEKLFQELGNKTPVSKLQKEIYHLFQFLPTYQIIERFSSSILI